MKLTKNQKQMIELINDLGYFHPETKMEGRTALSLKKKGILKVESFKCDPLFLSSVSVVKYVKS